LKNRFVDTNVFIHGLINPDKELEGHEIQLKEAAGKIIERIYNGELVGISTAQISEMANIIENLAPAIAMDIEDFLINMPTVKVYSVTRKTTQDAYDIAKKYQPNKIGLNDCIAYVIMKKHGYDEIYSFDKDFDTLSGVKKINL
jgi:predicted nucleic acid-binding protein